MAADSNWYFEIANDSPNGFKFSDAYETHAMKLTHEKGQQRNSMTAMLVAPKRPEDIDEEWPANRAFGEVLTFDTRRPWMQRGRDDLYYGGALTIISKFGLDSMQEAFHDVLGYRSVRDDLVSWRMDDAVMISGFLGAHKSLTNGLRFEAEAELGSRRNGLRAKIEKPVNCETFSWTYLAAIELVANDEIVSAAPVSADIRHIVPTIGAGFCTKWRGYSIRISEELSLPRISSDNELFPMVRLSIAF